jgi:hypothetical protein
MIQHCEGEEKTKASVIVFLQTFQRQTCRSDHTTSSDVKESPRMRDFVLQETAIWDGIDQTLSQLVASCFLLEWCAKREAVAMTKFRISRHSYGLYTVCAACA